MKVTVAKPDKPVWEGEARQILLPLQSGDITVLENHAPMVGLLREGELVISSSEQVKILVKRGIVTISANQVDILVR